MLPILGFTIALTALTFAAVLTLIGQRCFQQSRQRMDDLTESLCNLRVSQELLERSWKQLEHSQSDNALALAGLRTSLEELENRFTEVESYAAVCVPPKPVSSGLNINRRVEAVRLLQEGRSEEQVAAELALALSEVRLIGHLEKNAPKPSAKRSRRVA